jgi:hypothetical protein
VAGSCLAAIQKGGGGMFPLDMETDPSYWDDELPAEFPTED